MTLKKYAVLLVALHLGGWTLAHAQLNLPGSGGSCDPAIQSCSAGTAPPAAPASCGPGIAGATCGGNGPASLGSGSSINLGAGNPINIVNGNKYQRDVDMPALPGMLGLEIVRHYNSVHHHTNGILGRGWKLSYETDLYTVGRTVQIVQADGTRLIFNRDQKDPSRCASPHSAHGKVVIRRTTRGDEYTWTWPDGKKLDFNSNGKLVQIVAPSGEFVSMQHDAKGNLLKVTDPQGRSLHLRYLEKALARNNDRFKGVLAIGSPVGQFKYEYGSDLPMGAQVDKRRLLANLVKVSMPPDTRAASVSRNYHYEDPKHPTLLTGITVAGSGNDGKPMHQRIVTWAYDNDGRAVMSVKGESRQSGKGVKDSAFAGIEQITLDRSEPGKTVLTNSLGQTTIYRHAIIGGEYRLLEVRGPGCASCGETNVRYGYDRLGRLTETTQLNEQGQPLQTVKTELDGYGRTVRISRVTHRNGKPGQAQWLARYEYAAPEQDELPSNQPVLIARPSIVPGREHRLRIMYNAARQPVTVTESGWSPELDGGQPAQIERTTSYGYSQINGRSLLTSVDGPLSNGQANSPMDSDITNVDWDSKGNAIIGLTAPGNFKSSIRYDEAGRIAQVSNMAGLTTTFDYDARNQRTALTANGVTQRSIYDMHGRPVEVGYEKDKTYKALVRFGFDGAGRNIWKASHLGILESSRFDTEGKLLEATTQSASFKQTQRYTYDTLNRLIAVNDAAGGVRRIRWNAQGLPDAMIDALGREKRYRYDAAGNLRQVEAAVNAPKARMQNMDLRIEHDAQGRTQTVIAPNGATTRYVMDDFGRTLTVFSPDSGMLARSYDAANRLVAGADANGNRAVYEYDMAGRIVKQTVIDARATDPEKRQTVTTWRYEGKRLVAVEHPEQSEHYGHDDQGRLSVKTVTVRLADGGQAISVTRYRYDELGQLQSVSLPDGSTIRYRRNGQNQVIALERGRIQTPWLSALLPAQTIVEDLERDIVGMKSFTFGNGIQAHYQRGAEGVLARIVHRHPGKRGGGSVQSNALDALFGIAAAHASQDDKLFNVQADLNEIRKSVLPGALSLAPDPNALLDHRYLWDGQGNLLHMQGKETTSHYAYDAQDRLIAASAAPSANWSGAASMSEARFARYFYDGAGNRLLTQEVVGNQSDTHSGTVRAAYSASSNRWLGNVANDGKPDDARYDATGQPSRIGEREYLWDALGKLRQVRHGNRLLARYRYNHRGERIGKETDNTQTHYLYEARKLTAELNGNGRILRQYVYLGDQPIAVIDTADGRALNSEDRPLLAQIAADLAIVLNAWFANGESTTWLHNNHLGATELATEEKGEPVWKAAYSPYGKIVRAITERGSGNADDRSGFRLNLRLPGQYEDEETGLYYNDHRYYDPNRGQYLTPDPLGLRAGINTYGYVDGNPLKYIDPSGLILFAFDGTGNNSNPDSKNIDSTNVALMYAFYDDSVAGQEYKKYQNGIGSNPNSWTVTNWLQQGLAWEAKDQIQAQLTNLSNYIQGLTPEQMKTEKVIIDIVGFSRGAAQVRDFSNSVLSNYESGKYGNACLEFRFMGLFETVAQFGYNGANDSEFNMQIAQEWKHVAQAYALNEHRPLFPLQSISGSSGGTRIEKGFIGAHADVGGGYNDTQERYKGDLSDVALMWMVQQAEAAGVKFTYIDEEFKQVTRPVIHDQRNNGGAWIPTNPGGLDFGYRYDQTYTTTNGETGEATETMVPAADREVRFSNGGQPTTGNAFGGRAAELESVINRALNWQHRTDDFGYADNCVGAVDLTKYREWLQQNYGLKVLPAVNEGSSVICQRG